MIRAVFVKGNFILPTFGQIWEGREIRATREQVERLEKLGYAKRVTEEKRVPQRKKK